MSFEQLGPFCQQLLDPEEYVAKVQRLSPDCVYSKADLSLHCMEMQMIQGCFYFRCENGLMSYVNMKNCIKFYQTAEEMNADLLKSHCSQLISNHWVGPLSFTALSRFAKKF